MNNYDVIFDVDRADFRLVNTDVYKAENICAVQVGSLNGGKEIGIDFDQFVKGELAFSIDTFKSHILNQLTILNCQVKSINVEQSNVDGTLKIGVR